MSQQPAPQPPHVSRHRVVNRLLQHYPEARYLEIGVSRGETFHRARAARAVAVDPAFVFDVERATEEHPHCEYHPVTSDEYFATRVGEDELFDVIYLDGLHTFEQTLRDLTNALVHLQPQGVIAIDDVRPPTYHASLPDQRESVRVRRYVGDETQSWMGDVYRLIWFIDTFYPSLTYRTVSNNHGQAVVWRARRAEVPERSVREVAELSFGQMALDAETRQERLLAEILGEVRAEFGFPDPGPLGPPPAPAAG